jgi:hypothetical protein
MRVEIAAVVNEAITAFEEEITATHPLLGRFATPLIEELRGKLAPEEAFVQKLEDRLLTKLGLLIVPAPPAVVAAMKPAAPAAA